MNAKISALRYSLSYEETLGDEYCRNRIFVELAPFGGRVLELGCNNGFISRHLTERGCRVTGVEIDSEAAQAARQWCEHVIVCDLNDCRWTESLQGRFDVIMCGDVLEHLIDPGRTLRALASLLSSKGRIVICLPNIAHWIMRVTLLAGIFEYQSVGVLDATHLRFFTIKTARKMIVDAGYRILQFRPIIGGRLSGHLRPVWQLLANLLPGVFSYQIIFVAEIAVGAQRTV